MNEVIFFTSIVALAIILLFKDKIVEYLDEKFYIRIPSKLIGYFATIMLVVVVTAGMLLDNTKEKFSGISDSYNNARHKGSHSSEKKPHRYFDINTYTD